MGNINYTLGKDYLVFTDVDPKTTYFLQNWNGLGFTGGDVTSGSPYGPIYNPADIIIYNTFAATFIIDEDWKVFEQIQALAIKNAPLDGSTYEATTTDINLYLMNNTYQKSVAYITMHDAYVQSIMNVENAYNVSDNTPPKTMTVIFKYQYHDFHRIEDENI